jgi:hypothetical protein
MSNSRTYHAKGIVPSTSSASPAVESLHPSNTIGSTGPNTTVANGLYIGDFPPEPHQFLPPTPSPSHYNFVCPLWGVQKQKDGAFLVVDPGATMLLGEIVSHDNGLVAHCDTEEQAQMIANALNKHTAWAVGSLTKRAEDSDEYVVLSEGNLIEYRAELENIVYCSSHEMVDKLKTALNRKIAWGVGRFIGRTGEDADWYSLLSPNRLCNNANMLKDVVYCGSEDEAKKIQRLLNAASSPSTKANDETSVKETQVLITLNHFNEVVKNLAGRILTIVDASFSQEVQRKAVVSLVKKEARQTLSEMFRYVVVFKGRSGEESSDTEVDLSD